MNLKEIRRQIESELQFGPNVEAQRVDVAALVNRILVELLTMRRWTFRYRTFRMTGLPDLEWEYADWTISQVGTPVRHIRLTDLSDDLFTDLINRRRGAAVLGAVLNNPVIPPETLRTAGGLSESGWGSDTFIVERAVMQQGGAGTTTPTGLELYLDPRFALLTNPKDASWTGTWTLQFLRYPLPRDLAQVDRVTILEGDGQSRTVLDPWDAQRENEIFDLDPAEVGTPTHWLLDVPGVGHTPGASLTTAGDIDYPHQVTSGGARANGPEAPTSLTAEVIDQDGDWTSAAFGKRFTYCYTWVYAGMESGPSPTAEATIDVDTDSVELTLEALDDADFGRVRNIYRRVDEGPWRRIGTVEDPSETSFIDAGGQHVEPLIGETLDPTTLDHNLRETPNNLWLRLWPRPDAIADIEVRYLPIPKVLVDDRDVPELPEQCHAYLVHRVVCDLAARRADHRLAAHHRLRAEEVLGTMMNRYLASDDRARVRGSTWGQPVARPFPFAVTWDDQ